MNILCEILKESADIYKTFLELESKKYTAVINDDVIALDDVVSEEEVCFLKLKGIEQKREKHIDLLGLNGKTLKEIIDISDDEHKIILQEQLDELNITVKELRKINNLLKTVIEVRRRRIDKEMINLGEKENTYSNEKSKNPKEGLLISKKI